MFGEWNDGIVTVHHDILGLTREDKLLSMLKVTGGFCKQKKKRGKDRQAWQGERLLVKEALNKTDFVKRHIHICLSVLMQYMRERERSVFEVNTVKLGFRRKKICIIKRNEDYSSSMHMSVFVFLYVCQAIYMALYLCVSISRPYLGS